MEDSVYFEPVSKETINKILEKYNYTESSLKSDVDSLYDWFATQPHFPTKLDKQLLPLYLLFGKGSIETTKQKVDFYFTLRSKIKEFFENDNPTHDHLLDFSKLMYIVPLPKLNHDLGRVMVMHMRETDLPYDPILSFKTIMNITDLRLHEDVSVGTYIIYDGKNSKIQHVTCWSPMLVKRMNDCFNKMFKESVLGIHLINIQPYITNFLNVIKPVIGKKVASRFHIHQSVEDMYKFIDKEILPVDFGGNEKSLDELTVKLQKSFHHYKDFYDARDTWEVNEELRPTKTENDDFLGYQGNFKQLEFD